MKARLFGISLVAMLAACSAQQANLQIRPVGAEAARPDDGSLAKAQLLLSRGEYALAIDAYRKAIRYDPANAAAYNGLAVSYDEVGRFDLSRRYYEFALARAPREAKYYRNLALSLKRQGKVEEAAAVLAQMEMAATTRSAEAAAAPRPLPALRTLAQIARDGLTSVAEAASGAIRPRLERLSLGEVRLSTGDTAGPVRAARSITVPIPAVEIRKPAEDLPLVPELASRSITVPIPAFEVKEPPRDEPVVAELTARPIGASITIELPEAETLPQERDASAELVREASSDTPLAELGGDEARPVRGVDIAMAAEPAELLALAFAPSAEPASACGAPVAAPAFESAKVGSASLAVFLGDFAPARLRGGASIDLPLLYRASDNLPVPAPVREAAVASSCNIRMADSPAEADALFTLLWQDMGGVA